MQSNRIEMHYYTYAYLREDKTPYYIGKGKGERIYKKGSGEVNPPKDKSRVIYLKQNLTEEEAFRHEIYMIDVFGRKDLGTGILRNKTNGGEGVSGWVPSEETKIKMSESGKVKIFSEEHRRKLSESGKNKIFSEETKRKMSEANKGKILSEETKKRMSEAQKGKIFSEQHRIKLSEANKNPSEETRRKISEGLKGKTHSEEHIKKISEANKGKTRSEESKKRMSEAQKGKKWWNDGCGNHKRMIECPGEDWKPGKI